MKVFDATYNGLTFVVEGKPVPKDGVEFIGQALTSSSGYMLIDEDRVYYVASSYPDIKNTLNQLLTLLQSLNTLLSSSGLASIAVNPTTMVCTAAASLPATVAQVQSQVQQTTTNVNTLIGQLI